MNLSLGNMIGKRMAINPDGLSLDLAFATDKTLTARKGPTPTFTRASTATFVGSDGLIQSAAIDEARFDHDPVTLACKGLLIEGARTNAISRSEELDNAAWFKLRATVSANAAIGPDGGMTADKAVEDSSSGTHLVYRILTLTSLGSNAFSVYAKASERNWLFMNAGDNFPAGSNAYFDLDAGTIGTVGANATASILDAGNGWYRCTIIVSPSSLGTNGLYLQPANGNGGQNYLGDGTSGLFLWGAQVEVGAFPTSYIPTTSSALSRSADVCSITGSDFTSFYNQSEGTLFADVSVLSASKTNQTISINDGTSNNRLELRLVGIVGSMSTTCTVAGVLKYNNISIGLEGQRRIGALAIKPDDFRLQAGASGITPISNAVPTVDRIFLNFATFSGGEINGHIARLQYFRKRLPNAKLITLTT